ncbi:MAG TPA: polysaccharide lyase family 7 protein, partial [Isosphaeraceae bacterium]|nr:polysaccharide lyase family 7 protein [Isosphaeraceae bacterium]
MRILYGLVCVLCLGLRVSGFADPVPPAKVLDLARWKIQLPIDTRHPGHPDEVRPPELTGFVDPEHFFVDEKKGGVVFRAECGGATT